VVGNIVQNRSLCDLLRAIENDKAAARHGA
jgi:hypothetical protein